MVMARARKLLPRAEAEVSVRTGLHLRYAVAARWRISQQQQPSLQTWPAVTQVRQQQLQPVSQWQPAERPLPRRPQPHTPECSGHQLPPARISWYVSGWSWCTTWWDDRLWRTPHAWQQLQPWASEPSLCPPARLADPALQARDHVFFSGTATSWATAVQIWLNNCFRSPLTYRCCRRSTSVATPCTCQVGGPPQCCQLPHSLLQQQAMLGCQPPTRQVTGCHLRAGHLNSAPVDLAAVAEGQMECAAITVHMGSADISVPSIYVEPQ